MFSMASHVALLRGINVGGHKKVPMAELRDLVASLGHTGVATYIQSGNVLFTAAEADTEKLAAELESAIADRLGVACSVVVLSRDELAEVLSANPYTGEPNPRLVHVVFLNGEPPPDVLDRLAKAAGKGSRESVTATPRALFLHTPDGFGTSELGKALNGVRSPGLTATARNWATATKLLAMCDGK
jgi:uncharacterized protein (DUF1697 family)